VERSARQVKILFSNGASDKYWTPIEYENDMNENLKNEKGDNNSINLYIK
jgi:hypothetical protein